MLRRFAISVLLGILTTIAVAWTLALWSAPADSGSMGTGIASPAVEIIPSPYHRLCFEQEARPGVRWTQFSVGTRTPGEWGMKWASLAGMDAGPETWHMTRTDMPAIRAALDSFPAAQRDPFVLEWARWMPPVSGGPDDQIVTWGARAAGWPMLCLRSVSCARSTDAALTWSWSLQIRPASAYTGLLLRDPATGSVPLLPDPLGFTVNTGVYAAAWFTLLCGFSAARHLLRGQPGGCPACGYDLTGLPPSTPCPECGHP
ncbi:MAG: hypothetical protein ACKVU4_02955 [Phycisphaerales bacterium]